MYLRTCPIYVPTVHQRYRDGRLTIAISRFALRASGGKNQHILEIAAIWT